MWTQAIENVGSSRGKVFFEHRGELEIRRREKFSLVRVGLTYSLKVHAGRLNVGPCHRRY